MCTVAGAEEVDVLVLAIPVVFAPPPGKEDLVAWICPVKKPVIMKDRLQKPVLHISVQRIVPGDAYRPSVDSLIRDTPIKRGPF